MSELEHEVETGLQFVTNIRFGLVADCISAQLALIRTLRGGTPTFGSFNDDSFDEERFERHFASLSALALPECWYWIRKLQARFIAGDYSAAIEASLNAERLLASERCQRPRPAAPSLQAGAARRWHATRRPGRPRAHRRR